MNETITDVEQLEERLSLPTAAAVEAMAKLSGDIILLGVGGKMGPTLARMARRASDQSGVDRRIIGVSRFTDESARSSLLQYDVETVQADLLDADSVASLPDVENVIFMIGMKFGTSGDASRTWVTNTLVPALAYRRFRESRFLTFSTGNVYGLMHHESGGSRESDELSPIGEYAMSALGRERTAEYFCRTNETPTTILRLNYACELRYGVLVEMAQMVAKGEPVDLAMGYLNAIWQGDANAHALCALVDAQVPPYVVNVAGPQVLRVRNICERLGELLETRPQFAGEEGQECLLSDSSEACARYGKPEVDLDQMLRWTADWIRRGRPLLGKPTHFQTRDGKF